MAWVRHRPSAIAPRVENACEAPEHIGGNANMEMVFWKHKTPLLTLPCSGKHPEDNHLIQTHFQMVYMLVVSSSLQLLCIKFRYYRQWCSSSLQDLCSVVPRLMIIITTGKRARVCGGEGASTPPAPNREWVWRVSILALREGVERLIYVWHWLLCQVVCKRK